MKAGSHVLAIAVLCVLVTAGAGFCEDQGAVALPPGVKAVLELDKAFREKTPTRERVCINWLWRWQPARNARGLVTADNPLTGFRRTSCLGTRLLGNMGIQGSTPVLSRFSSPVAAGKAEKRWLDGLYLDQPEQWDLPYRFFHW